MRNRHVDQRVYLAQANDVEFDIIAQLGDLAPQQPAAPGRFAPAVEHFRLEAVGARLPDVTNALAPTQVGAARRQAAASTRPRRGRGAAGAAVTSQRTRAYRLCLLSWAGRSRPSAHRADEARSVPMGQAEPARLARQSRAGTARSGALAGRPGQGTPPCRRRWVVDAVRAVRPDAEIHAVVGDRMTSPQHLGHSRGCGSWRATPARAQATRWSGLSAIRSPACSKRSTHARPRRLSRASSYPSRAYDREHGTNLQRVLEACPRS